MPKRRKAPRLSCGGFDGPKAVEALLASADGASVITTLRGLPRLSGGGLGDPKAEEAPSPQRRGPQWSQSGGGPVASGEGATVLPKRRRPRRSSVSGFDDQ